MELFIAIGLEAESAKRLIDYTKTTYPELPAEHPADLHVTLHYIGETQETNAVAEKLSTFARPAFSLRFGGMGCFLSHDGAENVLWHGVEDSEDLTKLRDAVSDALKDIPFRRAPHFTPHITLSYMAGDFDARRLTDKTPLTGEIWQVREFQLWQVLPGKGKPAFRKIAAYRLSGDTHRGQARLLCVNDFHGALEENTVDLGAARFVTAVRAYLHRHPQTAVVFGGDNCFGEPVSELLAGKPVLDMMRALETKATVLGNHDLDAPVEEVARWGEYGGFSLLAANLRRRTDKTLPPFADAYTVLTVNGFRIGVIGLCTAEALPGPDHPKEWADYELTSAAEAAREYAALLEEKRQAGEIDAVVALTHFGLRLAGGGAVYGEEALETAAAAELDGMFTAHYHRFLQTMLGNVPVTQGGCRGQGFSALLFTFDAQRELLSVVPLCYNLSGKHEQYAPDAEIRAQTERYYKDAEPTLGAILFTAEEDIQNRSEADSSLPLTGTSLTKLATEVMRRESGCRIAMTYAGRIGGAGFRKGPVTLRDFYKAYAFANILVTTRMSGAEIAENIRIGMRTLQEDGASPLAVGGLCVTVDPTLPAGKRVLDIRLENGERLQRDAQYSVVIEDYLATNPFGFRFPQAELLTYRNQTLRELMLRYFRETGTLRQMLPTNIILKRKR